MEEELLKRKKKEIKVRYMKNLCVHSVDQSLDVLDHESAESPTPRDGELELANINLRVRSLVFSQAEVPILI